MFREKNRVLWNPGRIPRWVFGQPLRRNTIRSVHPVEKLVEWIYVFPHNLSVRQDFQQEPSNAARDECVAIRQPLSAANYSAKP